MAKMQSGGMKLHDGLKKTIPSGDSGMRPSKGRVGDNPTRDSVGSGHSLGGRTA